MYLYKYVDSVPKGHTNFLNFIHQNRSSIAELGYIELNNEFDKIQMGNDKGHLPIMNLLSPTMPNDWRQVATYEAGLCYALATRGMIYC